MKKVSTTFIVLAITLLSLMSCVKQDIDQETFVDQQEQVADAEWNGDAVDEEDDD